MPAERPAMRHVREVLRFRTAGISGNEIARRLNLAPSTVRLTLQRLAAAGLGWPLPTELTDAALEARLFSAVGTKQGHRRHAEPEWAEVHCELKRTCGTSTSTLAQPGGICVSRMERDQVRDKLALTFEDLGQQQVKNIARPVRAYRVLTDAAVRVG